MWKEKNLMIIIQINIMKKNIEYAIDDNIVNTFDNIRLKKTDGLKVFSIIGFNRNKTRIKQIIFLHQQV